MFILASFAMIDAFFRENTSRLKIVFGDGKLTQRINLIYSY